MVKTTRDSTYVKSRTRARAEVGNMKELYRPHGAVLLGTFTHSRRMLISCGSCATCASMQRIFKETENLDDDRSRRSQSQCQDDRSDGTVTLERTISNVHKKEFTLAKAGPSHDHVRRQDPWPLRVPFTQRTESLATFISASRKHWAIYTNAMHRYKNTKSENVLIDSCGSVVLTAFGISRAVL